MRSYSFFKESTGLALAARQLWSDTTAKVMATTARRLTTKIHAGIFVRKANWLIKTRNIVNAIPSLMTFIKAGIQRHLIVRSPIARLTS